MTLSSDLYPSPDRCVTWRWTAVTAPGRAGLPVVTTTAAVGGPACVGHGRVISPPPSAAVSPVRVSAWRSPTAHGECLSVMSVPAGLLFIRSSICLSVCLSTCCIYVSLSVCLTVFLLALCQSFCLSICLSTCCLYVSLSVCLSVYLQAFHLFIRSSIYISVCLSTCYLYVSLSICLTFYLLSSCPFVRPSVYGLDHT